MRKRTNSGELGAHVYNHDHSHYQGQNVHEVICRLKDERVRNLDGPRVTLRLDPDAIVDCLVSDKSTQWYCGLFAYRLEVSKAHLRSE